MFLLLFLFNLLLKTYDVILEFLFNIIFVCPPFEKEGVPFRVEDLRTKITP